MSGIGLKTTDRGETASGAPKPLPTTSNGSASVLTASRNEEDNFLPEGYEDPTSMSRIAVMTHSSAITISFKDVKMYLHKRRSVVRRHNLRATS
jgi:hypothetical protein